MKFAVQTNPKSEIIGNIVKIFEVESVESNMSKILKVYSVKFAV